MQSIHSDIDGFNCFIRKEFLYNFEQGHGGYVEAYVFAMSSYPGHLPTFSALVEDKYLFHYLPAHALTMKDSKMLQPEQASYFNCPAGEVSINKFSYLQGKKCHVYNRDGTFRTLGTYLMTFDWHQDNELCHLVIQDDGNYIMYPSHKLSFSDGLSDLPAFKKLKAEFKLVKVKK